MRVIDARVRLRTQPLMKAWTTELNPVFEDYIDLYNMSSRLSVIPVEELLEYALESGIEKMVVCGGNPEDNNHILGVSRQFPQIIPVAGVGLADGVLHALEQIKRCQDEGFAAINLSPFAAKRDINDRLYYPLYAYSEFIGMPVIMHASIHFWRGAYMWHGQPQYVDEVAVDFPTLKIIMSHGGNGFGPIVLAVAQRHRNVFLEFSALTPSYMAPEFLRAANTYLKRRCLFGTDYPLMEFGKAVDLWKAALRDDVWELFFYQNVLDALQIDSEK
jgi:predicted TIM-barrel fold metal-dependent hydrolase